MRKFAFLGLVLVGCGSKIDTPAETVPDTGASVVVDSGVAETIAPEADAIADGGGVKPTAETTCKRLVAAMCSKATETCCTESGATFLPGWCNDVVMGYCTSRIDAVNAGRATYEADQLEACAKSYEAPSIACRAEFIPSVRAGSACAHLFNGTKEAGSDCTNGAECKAPPGGIAYCDAMAKKCRASMVVAEGATCNFVGSTLRYCDDGLYCDFSTSMAACRKELATGAACTSTNYIACGYSATCVDGKCGAGLPEGAACAENSECSSWTCAMGKCNPTLYPRVDKGLCNTGM